MRFSENRETYSKIATLYYLADKSQGDIANIFNVSRFKISRVLKKCRALKIVEFKVNSIPEYFHKLESEIAKALNISEVTIVSSGSTSQESKDRVAKRAAKYLEDHIKDNMNIGLSWGSTIQRIIKYYQKSECFPKTVFVQLSGSLCSKSLIEDGYIDGSHFVQSLASKAQSNWSVFPVPYIVQNPALKEMLYEEPHIKQHVELFKELDIALISLGPDNPSKSVSYLSGYLTYEEAKKLADEGMSADICGTRLAMNGEIRETIMTNRVLTIDLMNLHQLHEVCAIGAGEEKAGSFIAGCRGGFIKKAIMDEICALTMLYRIQNGD